MEITKCRTLADPLRVHLWSLDRRTRVQQKQHKAEHSEKQRRQKKYAQRMCTMCTCAVYACLVQIVCLYARVRYMCTRECTPGSGISLRPDRRCAKKWSVIRRFT